MQGLCTAICTAHVQRAHQAGEKIDWGPCRVEGGSGAAAGMGEPPLENGCVLNGTGPLVTQVCALTEGQ